MAREEDGAHPRLRRDVRLVLLTAASGATDALSFLGLGQVFTAVMTGNLVLLGVAFGRGTLGEAARAAAAVPAFAIGVAVASRITRGRGRVAADRRAWPAGVTAALLVEALLELGLVTGWLATHGRPTGDVEVLLVVVSAIAMGVQSGWVRGLGVPALSTTYLTGTLTWMVTRLAAGERPRGLAAPATGIAAMIAGAVVTAEVLTRARPFAVLVPAGLVMLVAVLALTGQPRRGRPR